MLTRLTRDYAMLWFRIEFLATRERRPSTTDHWAGTQWLMNHDTGMWQSVALAGISTGQ